MSPQADGEGQAAVVRHGSEMVMNDGPTKARRHERMIELSRRALFGLSAPWLTHPSTRHKQPHTHEQRESHTPFSTKFSLAAN